MGRTSRRTAVVAAFAVALLAPSVAHAGPYEDVFADFQQDKKITACDHSEADLRQAKREIPGDIDQYAKRFPAALDAAIAEHKSGCPDTPADTAAGGSAAPAEPTPPAAQQGTPQPPGTSTPAQEAADGAIAKAAKEDAGDGSALPAPLLGLVILAAVLLLALAGWALARFFAWEPRWVPDARHAVAEAGWRAGGAWADFTDWVRSRRTA